MCKSDVLLVNAIAFRGYQGFLTSAELKSAITNDFKQFLRPEIILQIVREFQPGFGMWYGPGVGQGR